MQVMPYSTMYTHHLHSTHSHHLHHTHTISTDAEAPVTMTPRATEEEVSFILDGLSEYLGIRVRRQDVLSTWSGIRPLAVDPTATNTADAVREHVVAMEPDGLLTVAGGKWTTFRKMAQDAIDAVCASGRVEGCASCVTKQVQLVGATYHYPMLFADLVQRFGVPGLESVVDTVVAQHLAGVWWGNAVGMMVMWCTSPCFPCSQTKTLHYTQSLLPPPHTTDSYGDRSQDVLKLALETNTTQRLDPRHPILEAEVVWAARNELCETAEDFLARRSRLAFLDRGAAVAALPRVIELMAKEKRWGWWRRSREASRTKQFLTSFEADAPAVPVQPAAGVSPK